MRNLFLVVLFLMLGLMAGAQNRLQPDVQATATEVCEKAEVQITVAYTLPINKSILFNGLDELVNFAATTAFDFGTADFSVEFYMKSGTTPLPTAIVAKADVATSGWVIGTTAGKISLAISDGTNTFAGSGFENVGNNAWHHVAVVFNRAASVVNIYVDGAFDNSLSVPGLGSINSVELLRAASVTANGVLQGYYAGHLDELRIWNKALTAAEIVSRSTTHLNPNSVANLVGYWDFNEPTSVALIDCSPTNATGLVANSASLSADVPVLAWVFLPNWSTGQTGTTIFDNPADTTTYYCLIGYCKYASIDSVTVNVIPCELPTNPDPAFVWVPNAFTPNGDLKNDVFMVQGSNLSYYEIQIFNRLGNIVYHSKNIDNAWDGTLQGEEVAEGAYTYRVTYRNLLNEEFNSYGYLSLMR